MWGIGMLAALQHVWLLLACWKAFARGNAPSLGEEKAYDQEGPMELSLMVREGLLSG